MPSKGQQGQTMRAPISVVIPTLNDEQNLPGCLSALIEGLEAGLIRELIVSDGGSTDGTLQIAAETGAQIVTGPASRGGQLQRGCAQAEGDWFLVLHPGSWLSRGWTQQVETALATPAAYWGTLRFRAQGFMPLMTAEWGNLRSKGLSLPYGNQGLLLPGPLYETVGGYADLPEMEDILLARRLRGHLRPLGTEVYADAGAYQAKGWLRTGMSNLLALARYRVGAAWRGSKPRR
jgi:hypothetical protein